LIRRASILLLAALPVGAFAIIPQPMPDENDPRFSFVGQIGEASGVLVAPNKVLTVKHIGTTAFTLPGVGTFNAISRAEHPDADLSIITIDANISNFATISNTELWSTRSSIVMTGFGNTGALRDDGTGYDVVGNTMGVRRAAIGHVDDFAVYDLSSEPAFNSPETGDASSASPTILSLLRQNGEGALASGDSGGGWFIEEGGQWRLVGINSFLDNRSETALNYTFSSEVSTGFLSAAVSLRDVQPFLQANGINPVPEPATMVVLGLGALVTTRRRKRA